MLSWRTTLWRVRIVTCQPFNAFNGNVSSTMAVPRHDTIPSIRPSTVTIEEPAGLYKSHQTWFHIWFIMFSPIHHTWFFICASDSKTSFVSLFSTKLSETLIDIQSDFHYKSTWVATICCGISCSRLQLLQVFRCTLCQQPEGASGIRLGDNERSGYASITEVSPHIFYWF